jgi:archaellum biogenesis protein FlaJ (TadC family)
MEFGSLVIGAMEALVVIETLILLIVVIRRQAERIAFAAAIAGRVERADPRVRRTEQVAIAVGFLVGGALAYFLLERHTPADRLELAAIIALAIQPLLLAQLIALWWTHDVGDEVYSDE